MRVQRLSRQQLSAARVLLDLPACLSTISDLLMACLCSHGWAASLPGRVTGLVDLTRIAHVPSKAIAIETSLQKQVHLCAEAIAAAMGEDAPAAGRRKPGNVALTAERLSCMYHLVKAKCSMTQAQHVSMVGALESLPAADSACEEVRKLS